jgi:hypothetical protein
MRASSGEKSVHCAYLMLRCHYYYYHHGSVVDCVIVRSTNSKADLRTFDTASLKTGCVYELLMVNGGGTIRPVRNYILSST